MSAAKPQLTQEQIEAMDETAGYVSTCHEIDLPVRHGGDMRILAAFPASVADGLAKGTMSLDIDGWDD